MQKSNKAIKQKSNRGNYEKLHVWQEAHKFTLAVYKLTKNFPKSELYGLTSQLRRASSSVPTNIVEGYGYHTTDKKFLNFLHICVGSLQESEYLLKLSHDLKYLKEKEFSDIMKQKEKVGAYLSNLIKAVKR